MQSNLLNRLRIPMPLVYEPDVFVSGRPAEKYYIIWQGKQGESHIPANVKRAGFKVSLKLILRE